MVLTVNEATSRIALSMKRLTANPWEELTQKYAVGDVVEAQITSILKFGMFARLSEGVEGLIHISCIAKANDIPICKKCSHQVKRSTLEFCTLMRSDDALDWVWSA